MRLKSLELIGFKSFPDRTILNIENGVTAVVGPNGSGKSNISDAIRWVLGELSAKNVRGSKMEDVIFSGSNTRKPLNYAEVSLTIDNDEGLGAGHLNTEYSEVVVTRRCYRSGESEYFINKKDCRLKDIADLFMNTGVGKTGYSIIGQGKIADIISQKSEERRAIFEEAAGISRYRSQKNESERKLYAVDENLLRVNDILSEINGRVEPLRVESEKAKKYLDLYEKKKRADVSLALYDLVRIKKENEESEREYVSAQELYNIADEQLNDLQTRNDKLFDQSQQIKLEAQKLQDSIKENREKLHSYQSEVLVLENDIAREQEQIESTNSEEGERNANLELAKLKIEELEKERQEVINKIDEKNTEKAEIEKQFEELKLERSNLELEQSNLQKQIASDEERINSLKLDIASNNTLHSSVSENKEKLEEELKSSNETLVLITDRVNKANKVIEDYKKQIDSLNSTLEEIHSNSGDLENQIKTLSEEIETLELDKRSKEQRIDNLKRMDELLEGYQHSVKNVMRASDSGRLSGIRGPVSKIVDVNSKYALAIETALGASIQNIVVEDESDAKAAIKYLKDNNGGRATFYPMSSIKPTHPPIESDSISDKGFVGVASELVSYDPQYKSIIEYLLAHIPVFDNLDNATNYEKKEGYRNKVVTLDGQLINAGGSFTGGSSKRDSGILTRNNEIEALQSQLATIEVQLEAKKKEVQKLAEQKEGIDSNEKDKNEKLSIFQRLSNAENTQLEVLKTQLDIQQTRSNELNDQINALQDDDVNASKIIEEANNEIQELESKQKDLKLALDEAGTKHETLGKTIIKVNESIIAINIKLAELSKDIENSDKSIEFAKEKESMANTDITKAANLIEARLSRIEKAKLKIEELTKDSSEIINQVDTDENKLIQVNEDANKQDETLSLLRTKIKDQQVKRDELFKVYNKLENKRNLQTNELEKITSRLWEDYELTYSTALELEYPPVTAETRKEVAAAQGELRGKLKSLGNVNISSIEEYDSVCERQKFLTEQVDDLEKSKTELTNIIAGLEREMCVKFSETIDALNVSFNKVFVELFGGGKAELKLTDPSDVLNCGIEINAAPPGKIIKSLSLLSGGEQSIIAIALLFAIFNVNPTPFCVLDEIDAALDDVNVARFAEYAKRYSEQTQFIIITHKRGSMERGDTIYGVTMPQRGVSKVISLNVNEVEEKLDIKL